MVWWGAFVSRFSRSQSLLSGADWGSALWLPKGMLHWKLTSNPVITFHSTFYLVKGKLLAQVLAEMFTFELEKLSCVYVKSLLDFWWEWSASNMLVLFSASSSLHSINNISCESTEEFKLESPLFYLYRNLPACLFLSFPRPPLPLLKR